MIYRQETAPNFSSRVVDFSSRVPLTRTGLIDSNNDIRPEWATPATIGYQIDQLIKQTDDSMHGVMVPQTLAEKLTTDMESLHRAKNAVSAIRVFGFFADVTQSARFFAANTVARLMVEANGNDDQMVSIRTRLAAELGHRQSKRELLNSHRVNLGE
jgi:hypothetical protein